MPYLFIGEKRSRKAIKYGWHWNDGRLAGRTLIDALEACGLSRTIRDFRIVNAYLDDGSENIQARDLARTLSLQGWLIVGMGKKAQQALNDWQVPYRPMIHPAARGAIRKHATYHAHVAAVLGREGDDGDHQSVAPAPHCRS